MAAVPDPLPTVDDPPDWAAVGRDVGCPLCGYNLRGLAEPRCPECGYRFVWAELLAPPPGVPFLFEFQPGRNVASFAATQAAGWRPRRLWRTVRPEMAVRPVRLFAYWLLSASLVVVAAGLVVANVAAELKAQDRRTAAFVTAHYAPAPSAVLAGYTAAAISRQYDPPYTSRLFWRKVGYRLAGRPLLSALGVVLCWPWLTFGALQVFAVSLRRASVRRTHVLRCVLYSCDLTAVAVAWAATTLGSEQPFREVKLGPLAAVALPLLAVVTYRLGTAYHLYLRFNRPYLTAAASQAIGALVGFKAALWAMGY